MFGFRKKIYISTSGNLRAFMTEKEINKVKAKPLCTISSGLLELTSKKSFNWEDLIIIENLGYKIMVVEGSEDTKITRSINSILSFSGL